MTQILHNSSNWIFLSFTHGAFGHLLGRCLMASPDVSNYDHPLNGDNVWSWNHFPASSGWGTGISHYVRFFDDGGANPWVNRKDIPSFGQWNQWHPKNDEERFSEDWISEILVNKKLIYTTHDYPEYVKTRFPNSKVVCVQISDNDWVNCVKNHIEKTGSYNAVIEGLTDPILESDKFTWHKKSGQNMLRDWEKYKLGLNDEEYVSYIVNDMKTQESIRRNQPAHIDCYFDSENKFNIDAIEQLHKELGITFDAETTRKVLDSFNLDSTIKKFL